MADLYIGSKKVIGAMVGNKKVNELNLNNIVYSFGLPDFDRVMPTNTLMSVDECLTKLFEYIPVSNWKVTAPTSSTLHLGDNIYYYTYHITSSSFNRFESATIAIKRKLEADGHCQIIYEHFSDSGVVEESVLFNNFETLPLQNNPQFVYYSQEKYNNDVPHPTYYGINAMYEYMKYPIFKKFGGATNLVNFASSYLSGGFHWSASNIYYPEGSSNLVEVTKKIGNNTYMGFEFFGSEYTYVDGSIDHTKTKYKVLTIWYPLIDIMRMLKEEYPEQLIYGQFSCDLNSVINEPMSNKIILDRVYRSPSYTNYLAYEISEVFKDLSRFTVSYEIIDS